MTAEEAIRLHREWKDKFRSTMATGETLDAEQIGCDSACPFGQWLGSKGRLHYGGLRAYEQCREFHAQFHREAAKVADAVNAGRLLEADRMLGHGTAYAKSSESLAVSVISLFND